MESPVKKYERENRDVFTDVAKKSETERRRSRKRKRNRMRMPDPETLVLGSDSESYYYSYSEFEAEGRRREFDIQYHMQVFKSDGFDVHMYDIPLDDEQIIPCDLDTYSNVAIKFGKFAVDDYNKKQPEGEIKLAFVKPLKFNIQHSCGLTYYLTFVAKDVDAPDDQSRTYQTQVFHGFKTPLQVKIFRPKLTEKKDETQSIAFCVREIELSGGFDVSHCPPGLHEGIKPMKLDAENTQLATKLGQCALKSDYRRKKERQRRARSEDKQVKRPVVKLKFFQPLKMNSQYVKDGHGYYIRYYLTFHAIVVGVPDDQSPITYQTEVTVSDDVVKVNRFRPKPTANIY